MSAPAHPGRPPSAAPAAARRTSAGAPLELVRPTGLRGAATDADLAPGYARCAQLTRRHGTTYYWGTRLLSPEQRRDVYAVYALCRLADDIVDEPENVELPVDLSGSPEQRLIAFEERFRAAVLDGDDPEPTMAAIGHSVRRRQIPLDCFDRFFGAMRLDITRTSWASWEELRDGYMEGSAAVIGEMMLPVLEPNDACAREPARQLGLAFQLTNFIRDVGEDLERGRVYLPADDLARHGADPWQRRVTPQWRAFLAEQIERNRELYRRALPGVELLPRGSAHCVGLALRMYAEILGRIEAADYDVFSERRRVATADKWRLVGQVAARGPARVAAGFDRAADARSLAPVAAPSSAVAPAPARPRRGNRAQATPPPAVRTSARQTPSMPDIPLRRRPQPDEAHLRSTWRDAAIPRIERALADARSRDPGGWHVVGASGDVRRGPSVVRTIAGREVVLWRDAQGALVAGPGQCPHMGARLDGCAVVGDDLLCRWHGLAMSARGDRMWSPYACLDDGVLLWVRLPTPGETPTDAPALPERPSLAASVASVVAQPGTCEPHDVVANRLDPWHGAWFHPYAFSHLVVDDDASTDDRLVTDVTFRLGRTFGVPVRAEFTCPDARTIVMTITEGEGTGSVVETHATPLGLDRDGHPVTMVVEATIASSPRPGFGVARAAAPLIRPLMRHTQRQLWVDDLVYAERRYTLRARAASRSATP